MTTNLLTEEVFARNLNTTFRVPLEDGRKVELELVEVAGYKDRPGEQQGMERFSLFFQGPAEPALPQASYTMEHERMGELLIFIVPIAKTGDGFRYQAVFNFHRE